jgi:hypothetical protein
MFEWWQTVALSLGTLVVGGVIAVSSGYLQHRWTTDSTRKAEERQAAYRVTEEERQYIRQHRRERMKPVLDFLEVAKRCAGEEVVIALTMQAHQEVIAKQTAAFTQEEFEKAIRKDWAVPDAYQLLRAFYGADLIAPTPDVEMALSQALEAVLKASRQKITYEESSDALRSAEQLVERYLAEV